MKSTPGLRFLFLFSTILIFQKLIDILEIFTKITIYNLEIAHNQSCFYFAQVRFA
jgi:hypothetical protein